MDAEIHRAFDPGIRDQQKDGKVEERKEGGGWKGKGRGGEGSLCLHALCHDCLLFVLQLLP